MFKRRHLNAASVIVVLACVGTAAGQGGGSVVLDPVSAEQARFEEKILASGEQRTFIPAMAEFRQTARVVKYPSGEFELPGYLYQPKDDGPFSAVLWLHGSEKEPRAQPELARFYTEHGYVFFAPIRHGHAPAPGKYIVDLQDEIRRRETDLEAVRREHVKLHDLYNADVIAAIDWLKQQPFVDHRRIIVSGVSYGGIQTLLTAQKGAGVCGFISFAPGAMSYANTALRERLKEAAINAQAPVLLLQAQNDYSTGPSEILAPILKEKGPPSHSTIYAAFGTTNQQGHGAFATWSLGAEQWGAEVLAFMAAALKQP